MAKRVRRARTDVTRYGTMEYNRQERLKRRLDDIWARAKAYAMSHETILEERAKIFASSDYQRASGYVREYLRGRWELQASLVYDALEWRLWHVPSNALVPSPLSDGMKYEDVDSDRSRHVWKHKPDAVYFGGMPCTN